MIWGNTDKRYDGVSTMHQARLHLYHEGDGDFTTTILRHSITSVDMDWTKYDNTGSIMIHCVDGRTYELIGDQGDAGGGLLELRDNVWDWLDKEGE